MVSCPKYDHKIEMSYLHLGLILTFFKFFTHDVNCRCLVKKPDECRPLMACVVSQVLKDRHPKLGLVQRAVSILLYGNGSPKKVEKNLSLVSVPLSPPFTILTNTFLSTDWKFNGLTYKHILCEVTSEQV